SMGKDSPVWVKRQPSMGKDSPVWVKRQPSMGKGSPVWEKAAQYGEKRAEKSTSNIYKCYSCF
ncbi:MAG: hypothetical protein RR497_04685, partial [Oscillospiraceae bacterium]